MMRISTKKALFCQLSLWPFSIHICIEALTQNVFEIVTVTIDQPYNFCSWFLFLNFFKNYAKSYNKIHLKIRFSGNGSEKTMQLKGIKTWSPARISPNIADFNVESCVVVVVVVVACRHQRVVPALAMTPRKVKQTAAAVTTQAVLMVMVLLERIR